MKLVNLAERKRTEELYRSVVELAPDSIVTVDMKGVITSSNTASTRILGYSKDELVGKHFSKIGVFRARDIPKFLKLFNSALRGEVTEPLELTLYRKDGTPILAEVRVGVLKEARKTIGLQAVSRDITERKRTEEALRESEERLRAQYKGIPVPAYTWQRVGEDFVLVDYNDAAQAITRGNVADFVGRAASEMYRDRPDIIEELSRCFAQKTSIKRAMEYGFTTTGETKHLAVTYVFVPPNLVMVHTEDITERKRTEEALRESEEKFKAQYKGIPVPTYTWQRVGEDFVLVAYNDGAEAITHGNVADFVGRTAGGMYRDRPDILEELSRSFIEKTTIKREMEYRFTTTGESKDLAVSYVFVPPDLVMVHTEDITQRKQAQREIEERRFYLEGLLTAAPDAIVTLDAHQRIVEWNPGAEKLFGYSQEEVIGRDIDDLITNSNTYEEAVGYTQMVMSGKDLPPVETVRYPKDGYPVDVLVAGSPILVGDELIGLVAVYTDITESKRVEKALERRATQLATVGEVGRQIASILDLDELLRQIVNLLEDAFGYRYAHIFLLDEDSNELVLRAGAGPPGRLLEGTRIAIEGRSINTCVARTGKPLLANDVAKERMYLHLEEVADTKSELAVPIKLKGEVIGTLDVQSTELNAFDESDLLTLQTLADQAAVAIENARLYEKEREQREEAETLRQATQALSTTLDLQEVFKSILSELQRVVPYDSASVHLLKGECLEIIGGHGFPNLDELLGISFPLNGDNPNRQVMATRAPFIVEDAPAVYSAFRKEPHAQAGIRAWLGVPLLFGDRLLGMIALDKQMPGFYTEEHARLALAFAAQAAVAIENARLHEETQRRLRELQMLHQASASILSTLELGKTLQLIMDSAVKAIPSAQKGSLHLLDEERNELVMRAGYAFSPEVMKAATFKVGEGYAGWALAHNQPVIIDNVTTDARFKTIDLPEVHEEKSAICAPLAVKGKTIGTITLDNVTSYGAFDEDDLQLLSAFADQAAIAIENARLYEETKRLAATDPLTGVWNRRHIGERLRTEVARARRFHHPLSVLVMDIDNLKLFNDTYGHVTGDRVIRTVAQAVLTSCREIDIVGRYGGDEFAVILPEADARGAAIVAGRILAALEKEPFPASNGTKVPINISIGAASYPSDSDEADRLFSLADAAMYRVKVAGGGQFASLIGGPEEASEELVAPFDVLQGLLITVDAKDRYTFKHSQDVTERSLALARALGLSDEEVTALEIAGKLHDVGNIGIPTKVLRKPGPLTPEEWKMIRQHPRLGHMILQQLPQMEVILDAVLHHHERWDGKGYPDGLKGKQIPKLARMLAIADAYSAMLTDRPYRKALSEQEALREIQNCAGTQFDPELADLFVDLLL